MDTNSVLSNFFFPPRSLAIFEIMWKNIVEPDRSQITIWYMGIATKTHSEYVILLAFPFLQRLHEHISMLPCTYSTLPV